MSRISHRSVTLASLTLLSTLTLSGILLGADLDLMPNFPKAGGHTATHRSTWNKWFKARHYLGNAKSSEAVVPYSRYNTVGSAMTFDFGTIYRISSAPRAGTTALVRGRILAKYKALGGPTSRLGFPMDDADKESYESVASGQVFEGGQMVYNWKKQAYEVVYYDQN